MLEGVGVWLSGDGGWGGWGRGEGPCVLEIM